ncbi:MAG: DUF2070 family protein [Candidatus Marsarchaeota archaeon]|jgi:putative membrane protein|nr:DUF2070 family protein [Candidatus Marsarchaeota archaeon]
MAYKSYSGSLRHVGLFSRHLPNSAWLLALLVAVGLVAGTFDVLLSNYSMAATHFPHILIGGVLTGLLAIVLPAILTVLIAKSARRYVGLKYILFATLVATVSYSVFLVLSGTVYALTHLYYISVIIILLGDASLFSWWIFVNKMLLHRGKAAALLSVAQPTLNVLFFIPSSRFTFVTLSPLGPLLIKLYAGVFVFLIMTYLVLYLVDSPLRKSLGYSGIDAFTQMLQNWLFNINVTTPARSGGAQVGMRIPIDTHTIVMKSRAGKILGTFFVPDIHYGPVGTLGSSNFPYMLERRGNALTKAPTFVMHTAVNDDYNAISNDQYAVVRRSFEEGLNGASPTGKGAVLLRSRYGDSNITAIAFGNVGLTLLTRAPKITEDITPEAAAVIRKTLEKHFENPVLIDMHNSRYESASKDELATIRFPSRRLDEYVSAARSLVVEHRSAGLSFGAAAVEMHSLAGSTDIAPGALNAAIFSIGRCKYAILQFNANNMLPQLRDEIIKHVRKRHGLEAEVLTTDTHYVNSLGSVASNVLGRTTSFKKLAPFVDAAIEKALAGMEPARPFYMHGVMERFSVWGSNQREKVVTALDSMVASMKMLVPLIIAAGFFAAAWIIYFI